MPIRYKSLIVFYIIILSLLTGCWDAKSLENLNIPNVAGYEITGVAGSDKREIEVYAVLPVFYKNAPQTYIIDITRSELTGETRSIRKQHISEELSLGSFQVAVFGSNMAIEGVCSALNIITRTPKMNGTVTLAVADGNINDIFQFVPDNYPNVGVYLDKLLENAFKDSFVPKSDVHQFCTEMCTPGWHAIAPIIKVQNNKIIISSYAIFNKDKMVHTITFEEARILSVLRNLASSEVWTYDITGKNNVSYSVSAEMKIKEKTKVTRDAKGYHFYVTISAKGSISELLPNENLTTHDVAYEDKNNLIKSKTLLEDVEKGYEEYMKKRSEALINKAQNEFKMDIFNWAKYAQAKWRSEVDNINWDEAFSHADVTVEVNASIEYIGERT